jgi:AcrR family transcriptional regulator
MARAGRPPQDPARQLERAHRILDTAGELILRWGYDKTTVDDVARQSGVAKGTIYLHWKTRDALFAALVRRERVRMLLEVRENAPATLRELVAELAGALLRSPLMKALLLGDAQVLGKLARHKDRASGTLEPGAAFEVYVAELVKAGVLRDDLSAAEHIAVLGAVIYGFLFTQNLTPDDLRTPDERVVELLAETCARAMETGATPSAGEARAVAAATLGYLDTVVEIARRKLEVSLGSKERVT